MKRATPRQYKILQKFCRDLFKNADYISERKLNYEIQLQISAFSTRYRKYCLQMQLITEKNKLYSPGPLLRYFKAQDFYAINKIAKLGKVTIVDQEIHIHLISSKAVLEIPENWEVVENGNYKKIFKIYDMTLEVAKIIVQDMVFFHFYSQGIIDNILPEVTERLKKYELKNMIIANEIVEKNNGKDKMIAENGVTTTTHHLTIDSRLIAAMYVLFNYEGHDSEDCTAVCSDGKKGVYVVS